MTHHTEALRLVPISRGDLHTALMDAIHGDLMRQNPGAFVEEDGNLTLAIPTSKAFLKVDVSSLAESAFEAVPASFSGGADVHHLLIEFANAITGATLEQRIEHLKAFSARFQAAPASPLPEGGVEALIAELKEARGLLNDLMVWFGKYPEFKPNPDYTIGVTEDIAKVRAFLARNGKGEG